jgi:hypothetical protein
VAVIAPRRTFDAAAEPQPAHKTNFATLCHGMNAFDCSFESRRTEIKFNVTVVTAKQCSSQPPRRSPAKSKRCR